MAATPPRYEIDASLDAASHRIRATQKVIFRNPLDTPITELYFHIYPHRRYTKSEISFLYRYAGYFKVNPFPEGFQSGDLHVVSAESENIPLSCSIEGDDQTILKVALPHPLAPGEIAHVTIVFTVTIPHSYGRFGWHRDIITLARWYPILSVLDERGWHNYPFYVYHQPFFSDAAAYSLRLTVAKEQVVASTGVLRHETDNGDGSKTLTIETDFPVRDFALGVSPSFSRVSLEEENVTIHSYFLKGDEARARQAAQDAASLMRFYGQRFGAYPYAQYSIIPSYLAYGGCQSSNLSFIDTRAYRFPQFLSRYFDFLVSHETGHQWFYNMIGSDEYREMFMDEGMNSFWIMAYLENKYGPDAKVMTLPRFIKPFVPNFSFRQSTIARYLYLVKNGMDGPVISDLSSFQEPSSIFALTYGKGAEVLDMLRRQIGEETFEKIMRRYTKEFRFKNIRLREFIGICNREAGTDLDWFFDSWLRSKKFCDYGVGAVNAREVVLENRGSLSMPVETRIEFSDGTRTLHRWDGKGTSEHIGLADGRIVRQVVVDPEDKIILDADRTNNYWPRKLTVTPVPLYFFAYEIPLFLPRDSYNAVFGPSFGGASWGGAASLQKPYDAQLKASSEYDFNDKEIESKIGYEIKHIGDRLLTAGIELFDRHKRKTKQAIDGGRIYVRKELWPASYGIFEPNDHATLYFIRDEKLDSSLTLSGQEDSRNLEYTKHHEAIIGLTGSLGRYGPYLDPCYGWRIVPTQEIAGHFLGGKEEFYRGSLEWDTYHAVLPRFGHTLASRIKAGWGSSADKNLYALGGAEGLRGYSKDDLEGARMLLGSLEYRMPLAQDLRWGVMDNVLTLDAVQLVAFFDGGKVWRTHFSDAAFKKDAGLGLRLHCNVIGILEKAVFRLDVAHALNDPKEETHVWAGISQAF